MSSSRATFVSRSIVSCLFLHGPEQTCTAGKTTNSAFLLHTHTHTLNTNFSGIKCSHCRNYRHLNSCNQWLFWFFVFVSSEVVIAVILAINHRRHRPCSVCFESKTFQSRTSRFGLTDRLEVFSKTFFSARHVLRDEIFQLALLFFLPLCTPPFDLQMFSFV